MPDTQQVMNTIDTHSRETIGLWAFIVIVWKALVIDATMHGWYFIAATTWTLAWTVGVPLMVWADWKEAFEFGFSIITSIVGLAGTVFTTYIVFNNAKKIWQKNRLKQRNRRK